MMRILVVALLCQGSMAMAQEAIAPLEPLEPTVALPDATIAAGGVVRVLDKSSGETLDLELQAGQTGSMGALTVTLDECRYPTSNPSGDAFEHLTIHYRDATDPVFAGWMIASSPALNAMDHPRYDVWALRCSTS